jgi:hypothetical protein
MKKGFAVIGLLLWCNYVSTAYIRIGNGSSIKEEQSFSDHSRKLYTALNDSSLNYHAFQLALKGYYLLKSQGKLQNTSVLSIVDYSMSSVEERFYLIDMSAGKMILKTLVAHGRNTGEVYAKKFSNVPNSYCTSLGFFVTGETYTGAHGLSLRIDGTERTINDNARARDIVIHAADYVSKAFINSCGRLGRSLGCPALPPEYLSAVVNKIKNGSCFFAYYPDPSYMAKSRLLNNTMYLESFGKEYRASANDTVK